MDVKRMLVNKYGAVDENVIIDLINDVNELNKKITYLIGIIEAIIYLDIKHDTNTCISYNRLFDFIQGIKKIALLTKCDDYEYQTETKLVKKETK